MSYVVGQISGDSLSAPHSSCIDVGEVDRLRIFHGNRLKLAAKRVGNGLQQRTMGRNRYIQPLCFAGSPITFMRCSAGELFTASPPPVSP